MAVLSDCQQRARDLIDRIVEASAEYGESRRLLTGIDNPEIQSELGELQLSCFLAGHTVRVPGHVDREILGNVLAEIVQSTGVEIVQLWADLHAVAAAAHAHCQAAAEVSMAQQQPDVAATQMAATQMAVDEVSTAAAVPTVPQGAYQTTPQPALPLQPHYRTVPVAGS